MNTMPQAFDPSPVTRAGFSVSAPHAAERSAARSARGHLTLVGTAVRAEPPAAPATAAPAALPYDLSARRHLAGVPAPQPRPAQAQAPARGADNPVTARAGLRATLEPLVFALVLLVSVAALAVAMRSA